ncbi:MAG: gamma-glutamyl-gamma-aminobutyrate hydrolase family protein [Caldilineaceae bacterium]
MPPTDWTTPPLIGITTYGRDEGNKFALPAEYVDAVRRAGGIPLLVPPAEPHLDLLLAKLDGLILAGGGDLDPELYAGSPHETIYMVDPERDRSELTMARQVAAQGKPTLGICRGAQVINVALGGSLIEHLPDEVGHDVVHRILPPEEPAKHGVQVAAASRLAAILQSDHVVPTSWHHQAMRRVADGLTVVAWAPDGTVEAAELAGHPWLLAVQWHPEMTAAHDPTQQRLFDAFVAACRHPARVNVTASVSVLGSRPV